MDQIYYSYIENQMVRLLVAGSELGLKWIKFPDTGTSHDKTSHGTPSSKKHQIGPHEDWLENDLYFHHVAEQLHAYFNGELQTFDLKLSPEGTPFQMKVWDALQEIPYGQTTSYGEIAKKIDNPHAAQAVGAANGQNPLPIVIPCHRVIGKSGDLVGFGGGLELKAKLLDLEEKVVSPQSSFSFSSQI